MKNIMIFGTGALVALASSIAVAEDLGWQGFDNPTTGYEVGIEKQIETIEPNDEKVVQRTFGRLQRTYDWQVYKDREGSTFDVEAKAGLMGGQYKGSLKVSDGYGSFNEFRGGVTGEVAGVYTLNTSKIDPFIGGLVAYEFMSRPRSEWQTDALAGVKFNIGDDKDLSLRYRHVLAHGMDYHNSHGRIRQDDGYSIALIGTKRMANKTSHTVKLEYEKFDIGELKSFGYEPDTANWLVTYKKTF